MPRRRHSLAPLLLAVGLVAAAAPRPGDAAPSPTRRFAVLAAHPDGGPGTERLRYAERDARKVAEVLRDLGGFPEGDTELLLAPTPAKLQAALLAASARLDAVSAAGGEAVLLFYYSGHADRRGLLLGGQRLELEAVRAALRAGRGGMRIGVLDACQSGAITRLKGGKRAPSFDLQVEAPAAHTQGSVIIASSSADEASQESDALRGSFFTHFLVSGLRGAADRSGDGQVSLAEVYEHVYHRTVASTAGTRGGTQHPAYTWEVRGQGAVVLTRLGGQAQLRFPEGMQGHYLVYDVGRDAVAAEVDLAAGAVQELSLPAGRYAVRGRAEDHALLQRVSLQAGGTAEVAPDGFVRVPFDEDITKGPVWLQRADGRRRKLGLGARMGVQSFFDAPTREDLFHPSGLLGLRLQGRNWVAPRISLHADVALGQASASAALGAYGETVSWDFFVAVGGLGMSWDWPLGPLLVQVGPRLSMLYLRREFVGPHATQPFQDLATFSPGVQLGATWPVGPVRIGVEARAHYLRYSTEAEDRSLGFGEAYLCLGFEP